MFEGSGKWAITLTAAYITIYCDCQVHLDHRRRQSRYRSPTQQLKMSGNHTRELEPDDDIIRGHGHIYRP